MIRKTVFTTVALAAISSAALAQTQEQGAPQPEIKPLTIGDPARPIDISHWVKGEKLSRFEKDKVYVVEFWATWCGPCRVSMPHLTDLQRQYKDYNVAIIGVSDEKLETVEEFLDKEDKEGVAWTDKIAYTLTTDPDRSVHNDYFKAAGQRGIPTAFIIGKDQRIEWIGHPSQMDDPLKAVVHDNWDRAAFKTQWEKDQAGNRELMKMAEELRAAKLNKDWNKVISLLDAQIAKSPDSTGPRLEKFVVLLVDMDQPAKAYAVGEELAQSHWDDPQLLNQIAWTVVDKPGIKTRDLDFALKLAIRANEITERHNGAILDTLARVYYEKADLTNAVKYQKLAVQHAEEPMAEDLKETLAKYEAELSRKKR